MTKKSFNTTGPCNPERHYMLPTKDRLVGSDLGRYIEEQLYWVLHAPRQTGKTTFLMSWMKELNESEKVVSCYVSVERAQGIGEVDRALPAICAAITAYSKDSLSSGYADEIKDIAPESILDVQLRTWAQKVAPKPLVVLFDEVDVLEGPALISFLRQLRGGFATRGVGKFPTCVALVGMRDLKDYLVTSKEGIALNPGSPFNIKEDSITLANFSEDDVHDLLGQHTKATGQIFEEQAIEQIFHLTGGQPWLVNSIAKECVLNLVTDRTKSITVDHVEEAKEKIIRSRAVHIDSLGERLKDPRVKRVMEPILIGEISPDLGRYDNDVLLCMDLGLIHWNNGLEVSNPIYKEVLIRSLNSGYQDGLPQPEYKWQQENGDLDMDALLTEFQKFWRRHGDLWEQKADYTEAFPHLLLMAFFQRVLNGGARLEREYAAGRGRIDMAIFWKEWKHIIEIKLVNPHDGRQTTQEEALEQIARYADKIKPHTQTVVIFDRTEIGRATPWEERLKREKHGDVVVWWC